MSQNDELPPLLIRLDRTLHERSLDNESLEKLLANHLSALFSAVTNALSTRTTEEQNSASSSTSWKHRDGAPGFKEHPSPTKAELSLAKASATALHIPFKLALSLIRQCIFNAYTAQRALQLLNAENEQLDSHVPLEVILAAAKEEVHSAMRVLSTLFHRATAKSGYNEEVYSTFLFKIRDQFDPELRALTLRAISALGNTLRERSAISPDPREAVWCMEAAYMGVSFYGISVDSFEDIVEELVRIGNSRAKTLLLRTQRGDYGPSLDTVHTLLDGGPGTLLVCALLARSLKMQTISRAYRKKTEETNRDVQLYDFSLPELVTDMVQIETMGYAMGQLKELNEKTLFLESQLLLFAWGSFIHMRSEFMESRDKLDFARDFRPKDIVTGAIPATGFGVVKDLQNFKEQLSTAVFAQLSQTIWYSYDAFLTAFPLQMFKPSQVETIVDCACIALRGMESAALKNVCDEYWARERSTVQKWSGPNVLLRLASGVFPQTFKPLIALLSTLIVDEKSAGNAHWIIERGLDTITEFSGGYAEHLIAIEKKDEEQAMQILNEQSVVDDKAVDPEKALMITTPSESNACLVQTRTELQNNEYRKAIPAGSIGQACQETGLVTWVVRWNGWGALLHILNTFIKLLQEHGSSSSYSNLVLNELISSVVSSLQMIECMYLKASPRVRTEIADSVGMLAKATDLLIEIADPGDWVQGSWLTKSRRELLLTVSSSCVAALTVGKLSRSRFVLEQLGASRRSTQPLHSSLAAMSTSAFPAVVAIASVAGSYRLETYLPNGIDLISVLSKSSRSDIPGVKFLGAARQGMSNITELLVDSALPLWLTSTLSDGLRASNPSQWLLPACALQFLYGATDIALHSASVAAVITSMLETVTSPLLNEGNHRPSELLYLALRSGLILSLQSLRSLQVIPIQDEQSKEPPARRRGQVELTTLQKAILNDEVINSLALLASGCIEWLEIEELSHGRSRGDMYNFMSAFREQYRNQIAGLESLSILNVQRSGKQEIEDLAAQCLSALFHGLEGCSQDSDIRQAPWPAVGNSALVRRHAGGERIREGIVNRIEKENSIACIDLVTSVLQYGQRAAARALMGSSVTKLSEDPDDKKASAVSAARALEYSELQKSDKNSIVNAIINVIEVSCENWVSAQQLQSVSPSESTERKESMNALLVSLGVRFLRVAWESQNNTWFRDIWSQKKVWALLASLLHCDARNGRNAYSPDGSDNGKFDMSSAITSSYEELLKGVLCTKSCDSITDIDELLVRCRNSMDVASTWRAVAADVLKVFASEFLYCLGNASHSVREAQARDHGLQSASKAFEELFAEPSFQAFGEVFSERWMLSFLRLEDWLLFPNDGTSPKDDLKDGSSPEDAQMLFADQINFSRVDWSNAGTLETATRVFSKQLCDILGLEGKAATSPLLAHFGKQRNFGSVFGPTYAFDVDAVWSLLKHANATSSEGKKLITRLLHINSLWSRADVQLTLLKAFAASTYAAVYTDTFAPSVGKTLTYASTQYNGKLCRCLARAIVCLHATSHVSALSVPAKHEMAMLISFLAARLTAEELDQPALTAVRFNDEIKSLNRELSLSPLGQLCSTIDRTLLDVREEENGSRSGASGVEVIRWLLVAASEFVRGPAFRSEQDMSLLCKSSFSSLRIIPANPYLAEAVSVALSSLRDEGPDKLSGSLNRFNAIETVFSAIATMHKQSDFESRLSRSRAAAASLLLLLARLLKWKNNHSGKEDTSQIVLRHLSGGAVSALFPRGPLPVRTYNPETLTREAIHMAWCASLTLASVLIPQVPFSSKKAEEHALEVLEFASCNLERMLRESLDLSGDWPLVSEKVERHLPTCDTRRQQHTTIARVEEAELASQTLYHISSYAHSLQNTLPELTQLSVSELCRFVYQVYRLIRSEPLERWIKPVTLQERSRSEFLRSEREQSNLGSGMSHAHLPWPPSPGVSGTSTPPRRSPSQAVRAAMGGSVQRNSSTYGTPGYFPPSPGMPPSPQYQSPVVGGARNTPISTNQRTTPDVSPGSPWNPHGSGIIAEGGLYFGEECARALLRALCSTLGALRRFIVAFNRPFFESSMSVSADPPTIGTLVALQYHSCNEIQRGVEGERRELLMLIIDNALHLTLHHVAIFADHGMLEPGVRDEVKKRISTVLARLRETIPPPSSASIVHSRDIDSFLNSLV